jgi:hypothetical protein
MDPLVAAGHTAVVDTFPAAEEDMPVVDIPVEDNLVEDSLVEDTLEEDTLEEGCLEEDTLEEGCLEEDSLVEDSLEEEPLEEEDSLTHRNEPYFRGSPSPKDPNNDRYKQYSLHSKATIIV